MTRNDAAADVTPRRCVKYQRLPTVSVYRRPRSVNDPTAVPIEGTASGAHNSLLVQALGYACRGWSIIPVIGKRAAGLWKPFQTRRADEGTLCRLFSRKGITGLAVVLGRVSGGLAVRDFDKTNAYLTWADANPAHAADLPTVRTARGYHVYGRLDAEEYRTLADGELRADSKHYVLLPPSLHPDGIAYHWTVPLPDRELPPLPQSLASNHVHAHDPADSAYPSRPSRPKHTQTSIAWWTSAIAATLPSGPGQRNRHIFELARRLKAIKSNAGPGELRPILREWHRQALPYIRTKAFGESWVDFVIAWKRVERPAGQSFLAAAAAAEAIEPPSIAKKLGYDGHLLRLTALCWQLARQWGEIPFPLGCEIAGKYLRVSTRHAGRLLKALHFDGVIELVSKGRKPRDGLPGQASEWRFVGNGQEQT